MTLGVVLKQLQTGFYSHLAFLILCEHLRFLFPSVFFDNLFVLLNLTGIFCFPYVYDLSFRFLVCDVPSSVRAFLRVLSMHSLAQYAKPQLKHNYTFIDLYVQPPFAYFLYRNLSVNCYRSLNKRNILL